MKILTISILSVKSILSVFVVYCLFTYDSKPFNTRIEKLDKIHAELDSMDKDFYMSNNIDSMLKKKDRIDLKMDTMYYLTLSLDNYTLLSHTERSFNAVINLNKDVNQK